LIDTEPDLYVPEELDAEVVCYYEGIYHVRTRMVETGERTTAILDNIPLLLDGKDLLQQLVEPGFVSLRFIDCDDDDTIFNKRSTSDTSADTTQLIFQMPWHYDGAAIFQGFNMGPSSKIDSDKSKVKATIHLLKHLRSILRVDLLDEAFDESGASNESYRVQNLPIKPFAATFEDYFTFIEENS
jgi:hypothetical protein